MEYHKNHRLQSNESIDIFNISFVSIYEVIEIAPANFDNKHITTIQNRIGAINPPVDAKLVCHFIDTWFVKGDKIVIYFYLQQPHVKRVLHRKIPHVSWISR